jgi:hypothetical protein
LFRNQADAVPIIPEPKTMTFMTRSIPKYFPKNFYAFQNLNAASKEVLAGVQLEAQQYFVTTEIAYDDCQELR